MDERMETTIGRLLIFVVPLVLGFGCESMKSKTKVEPPDADISLSEASVADAARDTGFALGMLRFPLEMYSWPADAEWCFTFVAVTNRSKPRSSLGPEPFKEGFKEWACGIEPLKLLLDRFTKGQEVYWLNDANLSGTGGPAIAYPERVTMKRVVDYARSIGLDFHVLMPGFE